MFGKTLLDSTWSRNRGGSVIWTGCSMDDIDESKWEASWGLVLQSTKDLNFSELTRLTYSTWPMASGDGKLDLPKLAAEKLRYQL